MLSQNLMSLIDTWMVGRLGNTALAAIGVGSFIVFLCHAVTLGMSIGVQTTTARLVGQGKTASFAKPLNAALTMMVLLAPIYSCLLIVVMPTVLPWINSDESVRVQTQPYVEWRLMVIVFVGINFAFRGYLAATHGLKLYLSVTLLMHGLNVCLNYALIYGHWGAPAMGVAGAGLATALAVTGGSLIYAFALWRPARAHGYLSWAGTAARVRAVLAAGLPYGIQQTLFAAGFLALFWIVGQLGTGPLAAATVVTNITLFIILPGIGLSIGASTLVATTLGRQDTAGARAWTLDVIRLTVIVFALLAAPLLLLPDWILGWFIHDDTVRALAVGPLVIAAIAVLAEPFFLVTTQALYAARHGREVMLIAVLIQWLVFLPLAWWTGPHLGYGLTAIWLLQAAYRLSQAGLVSLLWWRRFSAA